MEKNYDLFLQALKASLRNRKAEWTHEMTVEDWDFLFRLANIHNVVPMIYEAVYSCESAKSMPAEMTAFFSRKAVRDVSMQAMQTNQFLRLYEYLRNAGVTPLVVKGIVCRSLYPNPDYRISSDEDLLIPPEQFEVCHKAMLDFGMQVTETDKDIFAAHEVAYGKAGSPLYIELHKSLFPPQSDAYGDYNRYFEDVWSRTTEIQADGQSVMTLSHTDHLFYLICHALKHFLHSGFGIRQVCDIVLFSETYGKEIDWHDVMKRCVSIQGDKFTAALFKIGTKYLDFDSERACLTDEWMSIDIDEELLLEDLLEAGVYGDSDLSRKHSSNITLGAVEADKKGKKAKGGVIKSVFPSAKDLSGRYPYLSKKPYLLPVAWTDRILKYRRETSSMSNNDAAQSLKIGNKRVELLKKYGIVK